MQLDPSDRVPIAAAEFEPPPMDSRLRRWTMPWEWWDAIGIYLVWLVLAGAAATGLTVVMDPDSEEALAVQILLTLVILIMTAVIWLQLRGTAAGVPDTLRRAVGVKRPEAQDLVRGVIYGVVAFLVFQVGLGQAIAMLVQLSGEELPAIQEEVQEVVRGSGSSTLLIAFTVAVLAPIGEELLFRGVLYQALAKHLPGWPAIGLSGLAFGLTHLEAFVIVLTFPLGMALAWMLRRTGTLVVPIVAHAVFNLIGVVLIRMAS